MLIPYCGLTKVRMRIEDQVLLSLKLVFIDQSQTSFRLWKLFTVLPRIHMPFSVYSPSKIQDAFGIAGIDSRFVNAKDIIEFLLKSPGCVIGELPMSLEDTNIRRKSNKEIITYCKMETIPWHVRRFTIITHRRWTSEKI